MRNVMLMTYVSYAVIAGAIFILTSFFSQKLPAQSKNRSFAKKLGTFLAGAGVVTLLGAATAAAAVNTSSGFIL
jgi:hypothetical protein